MVSYSELVQNIFTENFLPDIICFILINEAAQVNQKEIPEVILLQQIRYGLLTEKLDKHEEIVFCLICNCPA
jgi:hypothetical protein